MSWNEIVCVHVHVAGSQECTVPLGVCGVQFSYMYIIFVITHGQHVSTSCVYVCVCPCVCVWISLLGCLYIVHCTSHPMVRIYQVLQDAFESEEESEESGESSGDEGEGGER